MKQQDYQPDHRRPQTPPAMALNASSAPKSQGLTAPSANVMLNDNWKRYADSRLKQFSTR